MTVSPNVRVRAARYISSLQAISGGPPLLCSAVLGATAVGIDVEVDVTQGMPHVKLVGLASSAVQEAHVRVLAAVRN